MPDPTDLYDISFDEVSLVDKGDNPGAHVVFYKRADDEDEEKPVEDKGVVKRVLKGIGSALGWSDEQVEKAQAVAYEPPDFDQIQASKFRYKIEDEMWSMIASLQDAMGLALDPEVDTKSKMTDSLSQFNAAMSEAIGNWSAGKSAFSKAGRKISAARLNSLKEAKDALERVVQEAEVEFEKTDQVEGDSDGEPEGKVDIDVGDNVEKDGTTEAVEKAAPKTLEEALALIKQLQSQLAEKNKGGGGKSSMKKDESEDIYKDLSPELRKRFEDMEKAEQTATARIEKMERDAEEAEYIAKARADHLAEPDEVGKAMRRLDKGVPEEGDFFKVQKAYQAVIAQGKTAALFKQKGSGLGSGGGSSIAKANELARPIMKANPGMSESAARAQVWDENPELAAQYREEMAS